MQGWEAACCRFACLIHTPFPPLFFPTLAPPLEILVELYARTSDSLWVRGLAPGLSSHRHAAISTLMISSQCNISICFCICSFSLAFFQTLFSLILWRAAHSARHLAKQLNLEVSFLFIYFLLTVIEINAAVMLLQAVHCIDPLPLAATLQVPFLCRAQDEFPFCR